MASGVVEFVYGSLFDNPSRVGRELHFDLAGLHAARRGDFRVICRVDADDITVIAVKHRADIYRRH